MDVASVCTANKSPHQLLYDLYNLLTLTEMKGYTMIQLSYILLKFQGIGNYNKELEIEKDEFIDRIMTTAQIMQKALKTASRHLWRCDPHKQIEGVTYLEITQLLQGYIENDVDLNPDLSCYNNCGHYSNTKSYSCYKNLFCAQQRRCHGKVLNCKFVQYDMKVCLSNQNMKRRYDYIDYYEQVYGRKGSCPQGEIAVESYTSWNRCDYCMCLCDEEGSYSDRYFSMEPSRSDVNNNRVITGIKFTKLNRIIRLQIQQGTLLGEGIIDNSTIKWVPVDNFGLNNDKVYKNHAYFTLSSDDRAIDLDVLQGKEGYVLTGVRFQKIGSHLNLQINVTPFNYSTGKLEVYLSEWVGNTNTEYSGWSKRNRIELKDTDVPTRTDGNSKIKSNHNEFLEFTHTSYELDAAQTTVPFLDCQEVVSSEGPNSGAGIYYKTAGAKSGGYIGIKLVMFNYNEHLMNTLRPTLHQLDPAYQKRLDYVPIPSFALPTNTLSYATILCHLICLCILFL